MGEEFKQHPNFPRHLKQVFLRVPVLQSKWSLKNHTDAHSHPSYSSLSDTISHLLECWKSDSLAFLDGVEILQILSHKLRIRILFFFKAYFNGPK